MDEFTKQGIENLGEALTEFSEAAGTEGTNAQTLKVYADDLLERAQSLHALIAAQAAIERKVSA